MQERAYGRAFVVLGSILVVVVAVTVAAVILTPISLASQTLLSAGLAAATVTTLAVALLLFSLGGYTRRVARDRETNRRETHEELHAAHASLATRNDILARANREMHNHDRRALALLTGEMQDLQDRLVGTRDHVASLEDQWARQVANLQRDHGKAWREHEDVHESETVARQHLRTEITAAIERAEHRIDAVKAETTQLAEQVASAEKNFEDRLDNWRVPHHQMAAWAKRINDRTDHELARMRHRTYRQLARFEKEEHTHVTDEGRRSRREASWLAEDLLDQRLQDVAAHQEKDASSLRAWVEEQFAAFLAGQQAQRLETEARLAAVGASRGVRVEGGQAYSVTTHAPFGRVHPIADVEGIGHKTAYALQKKGILDTEHLWHADTAQLSKDLGITARQVRQWQSQAELMALHGVGRQWAELLAVSGVTSIAHLANLHPRELMELLRTHGSSHDIQRSHIGLGKAKDFIGLAREHHPDAPVYV